MTSRFNTSAVIIALFCILNLIVAVSSYYYNYYEFTVYGQTKDTKSNDDDNISKAQVGDIKIAYKKFGKGEPIVLINGYSESMKFWDPIFLDKLSANHTVIVFDNRGIGNTDPGTKNFTINQFAQDTIGLLSVLNIPKSDILGYSMGGMIAQELILNSSNSNKVDDLILFATSCGGKNSTLGDPSALNQLQNKTGSNEDKKKRWIPLQLTDRWIQQNPDYMKKFEFVKYPSNEILKLQEAAIFPWFEDGICDQLPNITHNTLIITGTDDRIIPPKNSELLADLIPKSSLKEIEDGGHKLMFQYPEEFSSEVIKFLK